MSDLIPDLTPEELEALEEEVEHKPVMYGDTAKAIAVMEQRLARLTREKTQLLSTLDDAKEPLADRLKTQLKDLNRDLDNAQHRLAAYRQQHEGRN
jgi:hypothetical protein